MNASRRLTRPMLQAAWHTREQRGVNVAFGINREKGQHCGGHDQGIQAIYVFIYIYIGTDAPENTQEATVSETIGGGQTSIR